MVAEENKKKYVHLVWQIKMTRFIKLQILNFLQCLYEIVPKNFHEHELEILKSVLALGEKNFTSSIELIQKLVNQELEII